MKQQRTRVTTMEQGWQRIALLALGTALLLAMLPAALTSQEYELAGDHVAVYNLAGTVTVSGGSGNAVVVRVDRSGADADRLEVEVGEIRGREALRVIYPGDRVVYSEMGGRSRTQLRVRDDGTFGDRGRARGGEVRISGSGSGLEAWADLTVSVPPGQRFSIYLGAGGTTVENVDGDIEVDTGSGTVDASHISGPLSIDTGSGSVSVFDVSGSVEVDTGSGSVTVEGVTGEHLVVDTGSGTVRGSDIEAESVLVDTGSGSVTLVAVTAPDVTVDTGSGSVEVDLTIDVERVEIDTGSGGVTIWIPDDLGASIEVDSGSGGIDLEVPVEVRTIRRTYLRGEIGDGRGEIVIDTGSGSVQVLRRLGAPGRSSFPGFQGFQGFQGFPRGFQGGRIGRHAAPRGVSWASSPGRRLLRGPSDLDPEPASLAQGGLDACRPSEPLHALSHNGEPDSCPWAVNIALQALERAEDPAQLMGRDADTVVLDPQSSCPFAVLLPNADLGFPPFLHELRGVGQEVGHYLDQGRLVSENGRKGRFRDHPCSPPAAGPHPAPRATSAGQPRDRLVEA